VDTDGLVELARPLGQLLSRLAAAQTGFISEVLGARLAPGRAIEDPQLPDQLAAQAVAITQELLPVLERTTVYAWRRHLATEVGRALLPSVAGLDKQGVTRSAAVGFIDISGFTRLSRSVDLTELAAVLERFETLVIDTVVAHGGRVIKNLGDEVLRERRSHRSRGGHAAVNIEEALPRGCTPGWRSARCSTAVVTSSAPWSASPPESRAWPGKTPSGWTRRWPPHSGTPRRSPCPCAFRAASAATCSYAATAYAEHTRTDSPDRPARRPRRPSPQLIHKRRLGGEVRLKNGPVKPAEVVHLPSGIRYSRFLKMTHTVAVRSEPRASRVPRSHF